MATFRPPIENLKDIDESINLLVYGDSGVGKTVWGATAVNGLILAIDKGTISAARAGSTSKRWKIDTWEEFEQAYRWLRDGGIKDYDWLIVDGLTMLWEKCMRFTLDQSKKDNPRRDDYIPAPDNHQKVQLMMKDYVGKLVDLPIDTAFTALPMNVETQDGDEIVIPQVHGQKGNTSHYICGLMSAFGHMSVKTLKSKTGTEREVRRITWSPTGAYTGKDRYGVLKPYTDNITLPEIKKLIVESGSPEARAERPTRSSRTRTATRRAGATRTRRTA